MAILRPPEEASRITRFVQDHLRWSAFWDMRRGVARPRSRPALRLYAESQNADTVIGYITAHS